ncbi:MAG: NUDIX domain-containing protein [Candidatus Roizmanbacteria bacterium]
MTTFQVGVKILFSNSKGQYLLGRRSGFNWGVGKWETFGGRINPGTTLIENLRREILEETGLVYRGTPKLLLAQDIMKEKESGPLHVIRLTYTDRIPAGIIKLSEEHNEHRWFDRSELATLSPIDSFLPEAIALLP